MKEINDGGKAFPRDGFSSGRSPRDGFAGKALPGILSGVFAANAMIPGDAGWPKIAYEYADAMIAQRAQP